MKISATDLLDFYVEFKLGASGWVGFSYEEGDAADTCFLHVQLNDEDEDGQV